MQEFIAECDLVNGDGLAARKNDHGQIEIDCCENETIRGAILNNDDSERLYEWLGQALGKHPAGVKG